MIGLLARYIWAWAERYKVEITLLFLSLGWAALLSYSIQLKSEFSIIGDDWSYFNAAMTLYFEGLPDEGRPFGIAAIFGLPLLFTDSGDAVIKWGLILNLCCWVLSILLVYWTLATRYERDRAFWYALFAMGCIGNLAIMFRFLPEPVFIALLLLATFFLSKFELTQKTKYLSALLATLLFAVMIKPVALGMAAIVAIYYARSWKTLLTHISSVFIYAGLALIVLQMVEMKKAYGDYKISYIGNITYYNYLGAKADCYKKDTVFVPGENSRAKYFQSFSSHDQQQLVKDDLADQIKNNTFNFARAYLYCLYSNSSKGSYIVGSTYNKDNTLLFDAFQFGYKAASKLQNILLTITGIILAGYSWKKWQTTSGFLKILSAFTLYIFFISGMSCFQADRFHLVFFPLVIMMVAEFRANKKAGHLPA